MTHNYFCKLAITLDIQLESFRNGSAARDATNKILHLYTNSREDMVKMMAAVLIFCSILFHQRQQECNKSGLRHQWSGTQTDMRSPNCQDSMFKSCRELNMTDIEHDWRRLTHLRFQFSQCLDVWSWQVSGVEEGHFAAATRTTESK